MSIVEKAIPMKIEEEKKEHRSKSLQNSPKDMESICKIRRSDELSIRVEGGVCKNPVTS